MDNGYYNGPQGQYNGQPGQYGGQPGQYNGQPGQYGGQPGQYSGQPGQYGAVGNYPGTQTQVAAPPPGAQGGKKGLSPIVIVAITVAAVLVIGAVVFLLVHLFSGRTNDSLYDIEKEYAVGVIDYNEAMDRLDELRDNKNISRKDIALTEDYIEAMLEAKDAFEDAEKQYEDGDYEAAIRNYRKVKEPEDSNYDAAAEALEKCEKKYRESTLEDAELLADDGEYYSACQVLDMALELLPDDDELKSKRAEYESRMSPDASVQPGDIPRDTGSSGQVISDPVIVSARTLAGDVLAASNVSVTRTFTADNAIDGYYDSCWCVSTSRTGGVGGKIRFDLSGLSRVNGIRLINGNLYHPEDDIYLSNGQLKDFTLTFSNGGTMKCSVPKNSNASSDYVYLTFDEPVNTEYIILTVDSAFAGRKYTTNVCLGEFDVY